MIGSRTSAQGCALQSGEHADSSAPRLYRPLGQRAAVCLGSRHSPRLTDIAARPPENAYFQKGPRHHREEFRPLAQ